MLSPIVYPVYYLGWSVVVVVSSISMAALRCTRTVISISSPPRPYNARLKLCKESKISPAIIGDIDAGILLEKR